jgi:bacteriocin-like protein
MDVVVCYQANSLRYGMLLLTNARGCDGRIPGDGKKDAMNTNINTDRIGLRELTDQELAEVSGGETVLAAVQNAVQSIRGIVYPRCSLTPPYSGCDAAHYQGSFL